MQKNITFIHGFAFNSKVWQPVIDLLDNSYTIHNIDLVYDQKISPPTKTTLVGWSLGGVFAAQYAMNYPDKVAKLILVNCSYKFDQQLLAEFEHNLKIDPIKTIDNFAFLIAKSSSKNPKILYDFFQQSNLCNDYTTLSHYLEVLKNYNLHEIMPKISCPVTHIISDNDPLCPLDSYHNISNTIIFPKAGHATFLYDPQNFIQLIS